MPELKQQVKSEDTPRKALELAVRRYMSSVTHGGLATDWFLVAAVAPSNVEINSQYRMATSQILPWHSASGLLGVAHDLMNHTYADTGE